VPLVTTRFLRFSRIFPTRPRLRTYFAMRYDSCIRESLSDSDFLQSGKEAREWIKKKRLMKSECRRRADCISGRVYENRTKAPEFKLMDKDENEYSLKTIPFRLCCAVLYPKTTHGMYDRSKRIRRASNKIKKTKSFCSWNFRWRR